VNAFGRFVGSLLVGLVSAILVFLAVAVLRWAMNMAGFPVTPSEALTAVGVSSIILLVGHVITRRANRSRATVKSERPVNNVTVIHH